MSSDSSSRQQQSEDRDRSGDDGDEEEKTKGEPASATAAEDRESLKKVAWFWPFTTRDEANRRLAGQPDGTFLVRDCSVPGDFTLTVRKEGATRCVRIYKHASGYSLWPEEPDQPFPSLQALVEFYHHRSLSTFNKRLDICLTHPLAKPVSAVCNQYGVFKELYDLSQDQLKAHTRLSVLKQQRAELDHKVKLVKLILPALRMVQQMYYEGVQLQDQWNPRPLKPAPLSTGTVEKEEDKSIDGQEEPTERLRAVSFTANIDHGEQKDHQMFSKDEEKRVTANTKLLLMRHSDISDRMHGLKSLYDMDIIRLQDMDTELQHLEQTLLHMKRRHEELASQLVEMGCQKEFLSGVLEYGVGSQEFDRSTWLRDCSRDEAVAMLEGLPHGAFLIRRKDQRHLPYVLSIVISGEGGPRTVQHSYIVRPHGRGYGFNPSLAVFESIDQLVLRHRHVSLKHYFKQLDVTLTFPVGCQELLHRSVSESDKEIVTVNEGEYANAAAIQSAMLDSVYEPVGFPEQGKSSTEVDSLDFGSMRGSGGLSLGTHQSSHTSALRKAATKNPYEHVNSASRQVACPRSSVVSPPQVSDHVYEDVGDSHTHTSAGSTAGQQDTRQGHKYTPRRTDAAQSPQYYQFVKDHKYDTVSSRDCVERSSAGNEGGDSQKQEEHVYEDITAKPVLRQTSV